MKKLYVGCCLTYASPEYVESITQLKKRLQKSFEVLEFVGLSGGTARDVYLSDSAMVKNCDLFLAECTYPSLGLGMEIAFAIGANKTVLAFAKKDAKVSRMILGIDHPKFTFNTYDSFGEIAEAVEKLSS